MKIIKNKIFKVLVAVFIISIILGIISYFMIDKESINSTIESYFYLIDEGDFSYFKGLLLSLIQNNRYLFYIWISGIILVSFLIVPLIIIQNGISIGILLSSLLATYKIKGIIYFILTIMPSLLINNAIYILCGYYSLTFTLKIYNHIKKDKLINIKSFCKNYVYIYIFCTIILILSSLFEVYISFNIIKFLL